MSKKSKDLKKEPDVIEELSREQMLANLATTSFVNAATVMENYCVAFGEQNTTALANSLSKSITKIIDGDMKSCETMLMAQAYALESIFVNFSRRATQQSHMDNIESFLKLALKAQSQCRATLETLSTLKNPPIIYAKQANISHGHQQVNNGEQKPSQSTRACAYAGKNETEENELLEAPKDEEWLDTRAQTATSTINKAMATVD